MKEFIKGEVVNPYDKTVYGVGYIGEGKYNTRKDGKDAPQYTTWKNMLQRCYRIKYHQKYPTYTDCAVSEEWYNFQNFATWYDNNYYEVEGERMCLDKDILNKHNKIYSPDNCIFVPQSINLLFVKNDAIRGDLPIGVNFHKARNNYMARCKNRNRKTIYIGSFNDPIRAFQAYKMCKEELIKQTALEYKDKIPKDLYNAMMEYKVEITD
ncbi:AP2 domain-containing protein [Bacillus xiapuensis]|uniref:AP2/ERF domain-containing protein n=1 Tax=Bacillus xiapuensis TaxID=2014075 RepID=A0ABU6N7Y9_9BACI|nr:hypothetical protein [Bacillus xiapuensis]